MWKVKSYNMHCEVWTKRYWRIFLKMLITKISRIFSYLISKKILIIHKVVHWVCYSMFHNFFLHGTGVFLLLSLLKFWLYVWFRFTDAYNFLILLSGESHPWCGFWDIMSPFLETFFNYYKVESDDSLLKILWKKISRDMRKCTECISRHHQAQEMYKAEYESSFISPLLNTLQSLDEERVSEHLKEANSRLANGGYHNLDNAEIVSLMFEVCCVGFSGLIIMHRRHWNVDFGLFRGS